MPRKRTIAKRLLMEHHMRCTSASQLSPSLCCSPLSQYHRAPPPVTPDTRGLPCTIDYRQASAKPRVASTCAFSFLNETRFRDRKLFAAVGLQKARPFGFPCENTGEELTGAAPTGCRHKHSGLNSLMPRVSRVDRSRMERRSGWPALVSSRAAGRRGDERTRAVRRAQPRFGPRREPQTMRSTCARRHRSERRSLRASSRARRCASGASRRQITLDSSCCSDARISRPRRTTCSGARAGRGGIGLRECPRSLETAGRIESK